MSEQKETTMREIKFRAWWLDHCSAFENGEYIKSWKLSPVHSIHFNKGIAMLTGGMVKSVRSIPIDEECILEQFTGLRDKNGREIYEGDILGDCCGLVVHWCDVCHGWQLTYPGAGCFACSGDVMLIEYAQEELEVIGNVHENPELLG